jgi:hypothetical protein
VDARIARQLKINWLWQRSLGDECAARFGITWFEVKVLYGHGQCTPGLHGNNSQLHWQCSLEYGRAVHFNYFSLVLLYSSAHGPAE